MPRQDRIALSALIGYLGIAVVFTWPLALHSADRLLGSVSGDAGVYVWNLWVFRHEIVAHGHFPFLTLEVIPLTPALPLTLHNYTTVANLAGFFALPVLGVVRTFNMLTLFSMALTAYAMFLLARRATNDAGAAWVAGVAFGFSPFMNARATDHFSLVQAAPLPLFILLFDRLIQAPRLGTALAAGATIGWAFLSDPYYAVYCVLSAVFLITVASLEVRLSDRSDRPKPGAHLAIDLMLVCLGGLIAGVVVRGGGMFEILGLRVSMRHLYNPMMAFTLLSILRVLLTVRPHVVCRPLLPPLRVALVVCFACALIVAPVVAAMGTRLDETSQWFSAPVYWRSSAPGADLLAFLAPNPLHPLTHSWIVERLSAGPGGFVENVASLPWTLLCVVGFAALSHRVALPRRWIAWTIAFLLLAMGPFISIGGLLTYVPTPWALLRYVPVVGAARMPQRFAILVALGLAMLAAFALRDLAGRSPRRRLVIGAVTLVLLFELLPAPRVLHSAAVPSVYRIIASDPRDVRVLDLPFGLRDGLSSHGNTTAAVQYFQTTHEKQILGGYVSRLPRSDVAAYRRRLVTRVLMDLSAGRDVPIERRDAAVARAWETREELKIGYVVVHTPYVSEELLAFAKVAFQLEWVATDGEFVLYRSMQH